MSITGEARAVIEALRLSPDDLRVLAAALERVDDGVRVRDVAEAQLAALPTDHRYVKSLRRLIAWAGDLEASAVRPDDIAAWARRAADEALADPKARHGVGAAEALVLAARAAFAAAASSGLVRRNPAADVELPRRPASRRAALSCEELRQVHLCALAHSRDPELDDLVFQFLRETACRRRGILQLRPTDLAPATRAVRLSEKYGTQRWVPVSAHLMNRLTSHAAARHTGSDRVLHGRAGGHLTGKWFEGFARRMQQLPWAAELGVSAHWIRHTTITDLERVAGVRVAAAYAGHADGTFGVTGTYTKPSPEDLRLAHARLFFDRTADATDPTVTPHLFRRAVPSAMSPIEFVRADP